jgi:hypothetical protein
MYLGLSLSVRGSELLTQSHHAFFFLLSLALLVTKIVANNHNATITTNDFALVANLLHAWLNLHDNSSYL